ncbi:MAG: hypothetical protein PSV35_00190 [bacterium]|nr:hypothetical protein [bacterium]
MPHTRFFNKPADLLSGLKSVNAPSFINVGGEQFHAVAVALLDHFKSAARTPESALKKILDNFFIYFPSYKLNQAYLTPAERMNLLVNSARRSEVVECMAYVLRQITADELLARPLLYRDVFIPFSPATSIDFFRHGSTDLSSSALAALACSLNLTIILSYKEPEKELRRRELFKAPVLLAVPFEITLQVQGPYFFPAVKNPTAFSYVGHLAIATPQVVNPNPSNETLADILQLIGMENKSDVHSYEQLRRKMGSMVSAGELNKKMLLDFFIGFLPQEQDMHQSADSQFFASLTDLEKKSVVIASAQTPDNYLINCLVNYLSRWLSTGQIDADKFFDSMECKSHHRSSPVA